MTCKLHIDFETRSTVDLRKTGSWTYSKHPSTDILCLAYAIDDEPVQLVLGAPTIARREPPADLLEALASHCEVWAHNVGFEYDMWQHVLAGRYGWPAVDDDQWRCSMALCARWGVPMSLDNAAKHLRLRHKKDKIGHALMLKMCKPRRIKSPGIHWFEDAADLYRLGQYCIQDVAVEREIETILPPLEPEELAIWQWTEQMNRHGILVDVDLVESIMQILDELDARDLGDFREITGGVLDSPRQVQALCDWLEIEEGVDLDDLRKDTIRDTIEKGDISKRAEKVLECRQGMSKSSLSKFRAILDRLDTDDNRVRRHLCYAGAHTLRWAGRGPQLQNLPSRSDYGKKEIAQAPRVFRTRDADYAELVLSDVRGIASMSVRSAFVAPAGKVIVNADLASIEARGLLWLAGAPQLGILEEGRNLYEEMASQIYGRPVNKYSDPLEYSVGKQAVLGLGYGMGWKKFQATCAKSGIVVSGDFSRRVVDTYRDWIPDVPLLWRELEDAFTDALRHGDAVAAGGKVEISYAQNTLRCRLPSGRPMIYWYPAMLDAETSWGEVRPQLHYLKNGVMTSTYGGKLTENIVQAFCRDLLRDAALRIWRECPDYQAILTVHDELNYEVDADKADLDKIISLMCTRSLVDTGADWAAGIPLAAEGWIDVRYKK